VKEYKNPKRDIIPCWYELGWKEDVPALVLRVHKDFIANPPVEVKTDSPAVVYYQERLGFSSFVADFTKNFGFDDALINQGEKNDFVEFLIALPQTKWKTDQPCEECTGSGVDQFRDGEKCYWCKGDGKKREISYSAVEAISASLNIAFTTLSLYEEEVSSRLPQLMTIMLATERGMNGASLGGNFTPSFSYWLKASEEDQRVCLLVIEAMKKAYDRMWGIEGYDSYDFRADLKSGGGLCTSCPGDACGIHPSSWSSVGQDDTGYEFSCHNTDTFLQQITLLSGLACLHDLARKAGV
jgi:hypothetical protein